MNTVEQIEHNKKVLLDALEASLGVVTTACRKVNLSRGIFYVYYNSDDDFKKAVDDLANVALDFAESQLHKQIQEGVPASTIFYLKTKGKRRGYIEKTEQDINIHHPQKIFNKQHPHGLEIKLSNN
ncbi:MAG: hypothetical protein O2887_10265 [Bacteroidetes bacterium]|nr:hypothetical protein [Bacteroidota bacterium]